MAEEWTYDLFVSYVDADKNWVEGYLLDALDNAKIRYTYQSAFALGVPLILEFERAIQQSRATLLVISETYLGDDLTRFTDILAQSYGEQVGTWPVIPLTLQDGLKLPPRLGMLTRLKASNAEEWETSIKRLCHELKLPPPLPPPKPACPYPGMRPFSENDEQRFFGRDGEIDELLNRLRLEPFLTVIGASGSGKSSLVFAGLIPKLKQSGLFGTGRWCIHSFRPGTSPLANLQAVLGGDVTALEVRIEQLLSTESDAQRLLLVVDQFEELFTQGGAEGTAFQETLLRLMEIPNVYLILTVRADFYPDLMGSLLWEKMSSHRFEVLPLNAMGLKQAIVKPAEGVDVYVDPILVERLLVDAKGEPGVLPLIQETLVLLWEKLKRRFLPLSAYELLVLSRPNYGATPNQPRTGLQVAIARRADAALADLGTEEKQAIARRIFLRLIQFGEGRPDTRRQQLEDALKSVGDSPQIFQQTLEHLAHPTRRLLIFSGEEKAQKRKVDIAHEALIAGWNTLQKWITERRDAEGIRRRLDAEAREWVRLGRGIGGLLDQVKLAETQRWLEGSDAEELGVPESLRDLIQSSQNAIEAAEQEEERQEREKLELEAKLNTEKEAKKILESARKEALEGTKLEREARSILQRFEIGTEEQIDSLFYATKIGHSLYNLVKDGRKLSEYPAISPIETLHTILQEIRDIKTFAHRGCVYTVNFSPDSQYLVTCSNDKKIALWDLKSNLINEFIADQDCITSVVFSPNGKYLASCSKTKVKLWDLKGNLITEFVDHRYSLFDFDSIAFSPDSKFISNGFLLWDFQGNVLAELKHQGSVKSIVFSPDAQYIATGYYDEIARLWDTKGNLLSEFKDHSVSVNSIAFSPDSQYLATCSCDEIIRLWEIKTNHLSIFRTTFESGTHIINSIAFSSNGEYIATGSADKTVKLWNLKGNLIDEFKGHKDSINSVIFSRDGKYLATASTDCTAKLWSLQRNSGIEFKSYNNSTTPITNLVFTPDSRSIIFGYSFLNIRDTDIAQIWDIHGNFIAELKNEDDEDILISVAFSSDETYHAEVYSLGTVKVWDHNQHLISELKNYDGIITAVVFSPNNNYLAIATWDCIKIWDISGSLVAEYKYNKAFLSIAFSRDSNYIAIASAYDYPKMWDIQGNLVTEFKVKDHPPHLYMGCFSVAFSPEGNYLATALRTQKAILWDIQGTIITEFKHQEYVDFVTFSPDGNYLATGSDNQVILWDFQGSIIAHFSHQSGVKSIAFSPDSKYLGIGLANGTAKLWKVPNLHDLLVQSYKLLNDYSTN